MLMISSALSARNAMTFGSLAERFEIPFTTPTRTVKEMDVDVAGTVPFNKLWKLVKHFQLALSLSPNKTVCILRTGSDRKIVIEYAPLKKSYSYGSDHYDFDHDLSRDSIWRDLSMNCLFYESDKQWVFDPTGKGAVLLRPIDLPKERPPGHAANTLFRLLYFVHRKEFRGEFRGADLAHAGQFIRSSGESCLNDFAELDPRDTGRTGRLAVLNKVYKKRSMLEIKPERDTGWPQLKQVCDALNGDLWDGLKPLCDEITFDEFS